MSSETHHFPISSHPLEAALAYLSVLAYPENRDKRNEFMKDLKGLMIYEIKKNHKNQHKRRPEDPPANMIEYANFSKRQAYQRGISRNGLTRIYNKRLVAAGMCNDLIILNTGRKENDIWRNGKIVGTLKTNTSYEFDIEQISLNAMASSVAEKKIQSSRQHVIGQIWVPSKPVIHLSIALREYLISIKKTDINQWRVLTLEPTWVKDAIIRAENIRLIYSSLGFFDLLNIDEENLIQLLPDENYIAPDDCKFWPSGA